MPSPLCRSVLAGAAAALLIPAAASADTFCVAVPSCAGKSELTPQAAVNDAAAATTGPNRIEIGSGTWAGAVKVGPQPQGLEIVGAGSKLTVLRSTVAGEPSLSLTGTGESVSGLGLRVAALTGATPIGLILARGARADDVRVTPDPGTAGLPVQIDSGGSLSHAYVENEHYQAITVTDSFGPGNAMITDSEIRGAPAISVWTSNGGKATIMRDRLTLTSTNNSGVAVTAGAATVQDTLIDLGGIATASGIGAAAITANDASVAARHVTILASGGQSAGASAFSGGGSAKASVSLANSLLLGVGSRIVREGGGPADASLDHVDTWPAVGDQLNGLVPVDIDTFSADPLLGSDLVPQLGSPVIDRASSPLPGDGATDLAGTPRALDGDGDCTAQPDIGAFEAQAAACTQPPAGSAPVVTAPKDASAPVITRLRFARRHGRAVGVRLTLSERAAITVRVSRCRTSSCARTARALVVRRRSVTGSATVKLPHHLRHGRYTIRVTAVDAAGNRAVKTARRAKA